MKKVGAIIVALLVAANLSSCSYTNSQNKIENTMNIGTGNQKKNAEQQPITSQIQKKQANVNKTETESELVRIFPDEIGTQWIYNGFAEYGHQIQLDSIKRSEDGTKRYLLSGMVADMSGGEGKGDFSLIFEYVVSNKSIKEIIKKGSKLPHKIREFEILRTPLQKGTAWLQNVEIDGKNTELKAEIVETTKDSKTGEKLIKVQYTAKVDTMPDGVYREVRVFKEKKGLQSFENTYNKEITFNYSLNSIVKK